MRALLSHLRTDAAVGVLVLLVLLSWPEQIFGFVLDILGAR